ncbi:MAG: methyltransferase regulatory domain-containing protein [Dehalococcoidia bacterium]
MNEASAELERAYNALPYLSDAFPQAHPDRMATIATLLGLDPAHPNRCRVLEVGCAAGGNLIPMAYNLPGSEFVGIDLAARHIDEGNAIIGELGLANVRLIHQDLSTVGAELGEFDYIIAHGVWSWVPREVREALFALCRARLQPHGVAYISYNVLPGYHMFQMVRGMMQFHTRDLDDALEEVASARDFIGTLAAALDDDNYYGSFIKGYHNARLAPGGSRHPGDSGIAHDELASINDPVYFWQFMERAQDHGLQYLGEARFDSMFPKNTTPELEGWLGDHARSIVDYEQYLDFVGNRGFRETLLCRDDLAVSRRLNPERIRRLRVTTGARPAEAEPDIADTSIVRFESISGAKFSSDHPLTKAAMLVLSRAAPRAVPVSELEDAAAGMLGQSAASVEDASLLASNLTKAYSYSSELVSFSVFQPPILLEVTERPLASRLARLQVAHGRATVTSLRHERVNLDRLDAEILSRLDGAHDMEAIVDGVVADLVAEEPLPEGADPGEARQQITTAVGQRLRGLMFAGLLEG